MNNQCILCAFKQCRRSGKSYLICRFCSTLNTKAYGISKHSPNDAKTDEKNKATAFTCTLNPKFHTVDDETLHEWYRKVSKETIRSFRTPSYIHCVAEYTEAGVFHLHGLIFSRPRIICKLATTWRKLGFVLIKPITDLGAWSDYIYKDYDPDVSLPPIKITS